MYYANSMDMLVDGEVQTVPILDTTKAPAIIETASGETVSIQDSAVAPFSGLKLFGKATQDGTPSPESPVPIEIAGSGGTVNIRITGGTAETQTLPLSTPNGLPGIPVTSGGNYTDATGQQWISDVIDLEAGTYTQNCTEIVFDGVTNGKRLTSSDGYSSGGVNYAYISNSATGCKSNSTGAISNRFVYVDSLKKQGIVITTVISVCVQDLYSGVEIDDSRTIITKKINQLLNTWYESGNPLTVMYQLATPVVTQLSSEEIAAYKALLSNYPSTNISSDSTPQVGIEASCTADTKTYIDNKISQAVAIAKA